MLRKKYLKSNFKNNSNIQWYITQFIFQTSAYCQPLVCSLLSLIVNPELEESDQVQMVYQLQSPWSNPIKVSEKPITPKRWHQPISSTQSGKNDLALLFFLIKTYEVKPFMSPRNVRAMNTLSTTNLSSAYTRNSRVRDILNISRCTTIGTTRAMCISNQGQFPCHQTRLLLAGGCGYCIIRIASRARQ